MAGTAVVYDIIARDRASATFRKVGDSAASTQKRLMAVSRTLTAAGRTMTHVFTVPVLAAGAASAKLAVDFQASMERIHTQAGASQKDVESLTKSVLALASKAQQSPEELADSLYHLKSVGMDNVDAMKALKQASDFAAVGGAHLEDTTNALAGAWRSGIKGAHDFKGAAATLNAVIGAGNMKMEDLNGAISTGFLPAAKSFGVSMKDIGSALAVMTDEGIPAEQAATRLRMSLSLLGAPSGAAEKVLSGIGLSGHQLAEELRKPDGLMHTIELLHEHLSGLNNYFPDPNKAAALAAKLKPIVEPLLSDKHKGGYTKVQSNLIDQYGMAKQNLVLQKGHLDPAEQAAIISRAFGGGRSSSAIMTLLNNLTVLQKKEEQVTDTANKRRYGDAVATQAQTAAAKLKQMVSSFETAGVKIGNVLLPSLTKLAGWISKLADGFSNLNPGMQKTIVAVAGILAVLGPMLVMAGSVIRAVKELRDVMILLNVVMDANPIGAVVLALTALVGGFILAYQHSETFQHIVAGVFYAVGDAGKALWDHVLRPVFKFIVDAWLNTAGAIVNGAAHAFGWVPGIGDKLKAAAAWFNSFRDKVNKSLSGIHDRNVKITADAHQAISTARSVKGYLDSITGKHTVNVEIHRHVVGGLSDLLLTPTGKPAAGGPSHHGGSPHSRNGGVTVNINGDVRPNNYNDFMQEMQRRSRLASLDGIHR